MIKNLIIILVFVGLSSCGYNAIYSKNNQTKINVNQIKLEGEKIINRKIVSLLGLIEENSSHYNVEIHSKKILETAAKDKAGNTTIYSLTIVTDFFLLNKNEIVKKKSFTESFSFNNRVNNFDLFQYQQNVENNLTNKIAEQIIIFLNS